MIDMHSIDERRDFGPSFKIPVELHLPLNNCPLSIFPRVFILIITKTLVTFVRNYYRNTYQLKLLEGNR